MRMILLATLAIVPLLAKDSEPVKRLDEAAVVFSEIMATPDKGIPAEWAQQKTTVALPVHLGCCRLTTKEVNNANDSAGNSGDCAPAGQR